MIFDRIQKFIIRFLGFERLREVLVHKNNFLSAGKRTVYEGKSGETQQCPRTVSPKNTSDRIRHGNSKATRTRALRTVLSFAWLSLIYRAFFLRWGNCFYVRDPRVSVGEVRTQGTCIMNFWIRYLDVEDHRHLISIQLRWGSHARFMVFSTLQWVHNSQ